LSGSDPASPAFCGEVMLADLGLVGSPDIGACLLQQALMWAGFWQSARA
jgi:hypothetical protein